MSNLLGELYQQSTDKETRKNIGQYYTPDYIIKYILSKIFKDMDLLKNPYPKIIDISCGAGYFLIEAFDILRNKFINEFKNLQIKYKDKSYYIEKGDYIKEVKAEDYWSEENIDYHILKHCIYGADIDKTAIDLTKAALKSRMKFNVDIDENILQCDSLIKWENTENTLSEFWSKKYDYIIGNPPYIGHKKLDIEYKQWLLEEYKDVFKDKSDISFCFFKRILDILSDDGISGIITSRYFMENPTGKILREYLKDNIDFLEIVDFYGGEIFKNVGVATAIYLFKKNNYKENNVLIYKLIKDKHNFNEVEDLEPLLENNLFEKFYYNQSNLNSDRWIFLSESSINKYTKIQNKTHYRLGDVVESFQGIITGCDKAFIIKENDIKTYSIEPSLIKKWVKNKDVERYIIKKESLYLIYSDEIDDESTYPHSIDFISKHRERLNNRRECVKGLRKWYGLQWGRKQELFEQGKIMFPYKASTNRFALDYSNYYSSADVYSLVIKEEFKDKISLEYLVGILNSSIYESYFKMFAKKIGKGMYDYYPNSVLDIRIVTEDIVEEIDAITRDIIKLSKKENQYKSIEVLENRIDEILYNYFELGK